MIQERSASILLDTYLINILTAAVTLSATIINPIMLRDVTLCATLINLLIQNIRRSGGLTATTSRPIVSILR